MKVIIVCILDNKYDNSNYYVPPVVIKPDLKFKREKKVSAGKIHKYDNNVKENIPYNKKVDSYSLTIRKGGKKIMKIFTNEITVYHLAVDKITII